MARGISRAFTYLPAWVIVIVENAAAAGGITNAKFKTVSLSGS
jgi:hypothetical protein